MNFFKEWVDTIIILIRLHHSSQSEAGLHHSSQSEAGLKLQVSQITAEASDWLEWCSRGLRLAGVVSLLERTQDTLLPERLLPGSLTILCDPFSWHPLIPFHPPPLHCIISLDFLLMFFRHCVTGARFPQKWKGKTSVFTDIFISLV